MVRTEGPLFKIYLGFSKAVCTTTRCTLLNLLFILHYILLFQGVAVSRQIGATTYVETSSKTCPKAIQDAFEVSALAALGKLNKSLSSVQKFGSHRYNGTWHRAKVDLNFRDRSKNCVVM